MSVSGTLSIIVAAVAVILGFLILRDINDTGGTSGGGGGGSTATSTTLAGGPNNTDPDNSEPTTTVAAALRPYTVIVANAAKVSGAAGSLTTALQGAGIATEPGTNSSATAAKSTTTIFYLTGWEAEAADLARIMGVTATAAMPEPPPLESGNTLGQAQLLVELGTDKANQPLPAGTGGAATTTTAAGTPTT